MNATHPMMLAMTLIALVLPAAPAAAADSPYTAVLHQRLNLWRLVPPNGPDLQVSLPRSACRPSQVLPRGDWSVETDAAGRPALRAGMAVPVGFPDRIPVVGCDDDSVDGPALRAPDALIDWIASVADTVRVDD